MASGTMHVDRFNLLQTTVTGTTDANGNLSLGVLPYGAKLIVFVWDNVHVFIPFRYNGSWYVRVQISDAAGTACPNDNISCSVYYIPSS